MDGFEKLARATSDCRPWPKGGGLAVCGGCGFVQKVVNGNFRWECEQVYDAYEIYHQGDGAEQKIFLAVDGRSFSRSERLLRSVLPQLNMPPVARVLDVGCGNGSLLRVLSDLKPNWRLAGFEINGRHETVVSNIDGVEAFYSGNLNDIPGEYDIVFMIHTLEHVIDPFSFLCDLRKKIASRGTLLIHIPDYQSNPFDLIICDHVSHFSPASIERLIHAAGFDTVVSAEIIHKERTLLAVNTDRLQKEQPICEEERFDFSRAMRMLKWLEQCVDRARNLQNRKNFGVFGTAIASAWLFSSLGSGIDFFVEEDPCRTNRLFLGLPVYSPGELRAVSQVFLPFPFTIAAQIKNRLKSCNGEFHMPPTM